jgi:CBS-domain-containing membrane protein
MFPRRSNRKAATDWVSRVARLQPWYLLIRFPYRWTRSLFAFVSTAIAIGIISTAAACTGQPLIFPSLGPSAFLFFWQPGKPSSSPRNAILSHGSGILVGWAAYGAFGLLFGFDTSAAQVTAAATSLGIISALMVAADIPHPPAASTTLIVSLGLMVQWQQLIAVMAAVVLLTIQSYCINRMSGIVYPLWRARPEQQGGDLVVAALNTTAAGPKDDVYAEVADRIVARQQLQGRKTATRS